MDIVCEGMLGSNFASRNPSIYTIMFRLITFIKSITFILFFSIVTIISALAQAGKGKLAGKITDGNSGEEIIGATVLVEGTNIGTSTDLDGKYILQLEPGTYTIVISYVSYKTKKFEGVVIKENETTPLNTGLIESTKDLEEVVVVAEQKNMVKETEAALLIQQRNAVQVSSGISAELIRKTPDRSTSDVLKRISGASIQEGKFAIIRGMNDRYNAGYLNGAPLPSTETDRKAFSFDVIPANLIENVVVIKSGSPDLIGDFGGGIIRIDTKNIPTEKTQSFNLGLQYHSITTFKNFKAYNGSSTDFLGFDDGKRKLPTDIGNIYGDKNTNNANVDATNKFNNDWKINQYNSLPNLRASYSLGLPLKLFGRDLGIVTAVNYNSTEKYSNKILRRYQGEDGALISDLSGDEYAKNINLGAILNLSYKLNQSNLFSIKNLFNNTSDISSEFRSGIGNKLDNIFNISSANAMTSNQLYSSQLTGDHNIGENFLKVKWIVNYGIINRTMPDYKIATYGGGVDEETGNIRYGLGFGNQFSQASGKFFSKLNEKMLSGNIDVSKQFKIGSTKNEFKIGGYYQTRDRDFTSSRFSYYSNDLGQNFTTDLEKDLGKGNIADTGVYLVERTVKDGDRYKANSLLTAGYLMMSNNIFDRLKLVYGLRIERFQQDVYTMVPNPSNAGTEIRKDIATQKVVQDLLPSINASYSITPKLNLRGAAYVTVNRAEFREISRLSFFRFDNNTETAGNPDLKRARIENFDSRIEYYFGPNEVVSFGAFYKKIENPIELRQNFAITSALALKYYNEKSAYIRGLEFELRKNFGFLGGVLPKPIVENIILFTNVAIMQSAVTLYEGSTSTANRPLQGQSPYTFNLGLQYEHPENGWYGSVIGNRIGRRISFVGGVKDDASGQPIPYGYDIWENPRTIIDAQIGKKIGRFDLRATWGDILRQDQIFYQDRNGNGVYDVDNTGIPGATTNLGNDDDKIVFKYNMGYTVSVAASYKF